MKSKWLRHDVAYGCFLVWALAVLLLHLVLASFTEAELAQGAGAILLLLLPLLVASFIAMVVGIVLSMVLWKHWPLIIVAVSSILVIAIQVRAGGSGTLVPIVYGVGVTAMCGLWFLNLRRQYVPPATLDEMSP